MNRIDWRLTDLVRRVPGVRAVVLVSADGLCLGTSDMVGDILGDQLAAAASGLSALAAGTSVLLQGGRISQTLLEMEYGYLMVGAVGSSAVLVVHTDRAADIGIVGYEMAVLASRVGHSLEPGLR